MSSSILFLTIEPTDQPNSDWQWPQGPEARLNFRVSKLIWPGPYLLL